MPQEDEPIVEFRRVGAAVRVTAMDPASLLEVSLQAPAGYPQALLVRSVLAKLRYRLDQEERRRRGQDGRRR